MASRRSKPKTRTYPEPPRHYYVYVIEVSEHGRRTFYVGQSGKTPEARAKEHASACKLYCRSCECRHYTPAGKVRLRRDLFAMYNPVSTRAEAEKIERELARKLRAQGLNVLGGH